MGLAWAWHDRYRPKNTIPRLPSTLLTTALVIAAPAHAGTISPSLAACSGSLTDLLPGATACSWITPLTSMLNDKPELVNTLGFFGFDDWLFDGKWEEGSDSARLFDFSGDSRAGSYTYTGGSGIADILMLFKSGRGTSPVGYLVAAASGSYVSPFLPGAFPVKNTKDISHISVYYRPGSTSSPGGGDGASTGGSADASNGSSPGGEPDGGHGTAVGPVGEPLLLTGGLPETDPPFWEPPADPVGSPSGNPNGHHPVPAPGVLLLMAAGLLGLTTTRRLR